MFKAQPPGVRIEAALRQLVAVYRSINQQRIALGAGPMRPARATVLGIYQPSGTYTLFVHLGAAEADSDGTHRGLLFRSDPAEVGLGDYERMQREAIEMVEAQGFHMERVDVRNMDAAQRDDLLDRLPLRVLSEPPADLANAETMAPAASRGEAQPRKVPAPDAAPRLHLGEDVMGDALGTGTYAAPVEISQQVSLSRMQTIEVLGRLLSLF